MTGPSSGGQSRAVDGFLGQDRLVERLAQSTPRHAHVEELVVERPECLQGPGCRRGEELHGDRGADAQLLVQHEGAGLVEDERGGHRAHELHDRGVGVLQRDAPPAGAATLPARLHELLRLDGVGPEVADLVARAEVFLELAGDDAELFAGPLERAVRERELDER